MAINPISSVIPSGSGTKQVSETVRPQSGQKFGDILSNGIKQTNQDITKAAEMSEQHLAGKKYDLHEVIISLEKADLSFRYLTQVRNKVLDAYNEVMRMQV